MSTHAWGVGLATLDASGATLDVRFRGLGLAEDIPHDAPSVTTSRDVDSSRGVAFQPVSLSIDVSAAPVDASDVYLRPTTAKHAPDFTSPQAP